MENHILYHYTSVNTLQKIIDGIATNDCIKLRGTQIEYLNDKEEFNIALSLLKVLFKEFEEEGKDILSKKLSINLSDSMWYLAINTLYMQPFITSFSEEPDSLPMWNTYADKGSGVAIGFSKINPKKISKLTGRTAPVWCKCSYDIDSFKGNLKNNLQDIYDSITNIDGQLSLSPKMLTSQLPEYMCIAKQKGFSYEKEIRLVKKCTKGNYDEIFFQESNGILKPYIEQKLPKESIKKVVIGPCANMKLSKNSIIMLLRKAGFQCVNPQKDFYVEVVESEIPFRNL